MSLGRVWLEVDLDRPPDRPLISIDARIDEPRVADPAGLVERLVLERGGAAAAGLVGDFAFAVWDPARRRLVASRDRFGLRSLYWARRGSRVAFATSLKDLYDLDWVSREVDQTRVVELLLGWAASPEATLYRGIRLVAPATSVTVTAAGVEVAAYWDPMAVPDLPAMSDADYAEGLREGLRRAVADRLRGLPRGGSAATLSGGLDSSPVACLARDLAGPPYPVYARVYPSLPGTDESRWVQAVLRTGGFEAKLLAPGEGEGDPYEEGLNPPGEQPLWIPQAAFHLGIARAAAADGRTALLFGESGDEVVNHGVGRLPELAGSLRLLELWRSARTLGRYYGFGTAAALRQFVLAALPPPRLRRAWMEARYGGWPFFASALPVREEVAARLQLREHFWAAAERPEMRLPRTIREDRRHRWMASDRSLGGSMADRAYRHYGIEQQHPFSDTRVLEYCLGLPSEQSLAGGVTRVVARRAFDGVVPHEVAWRVDKSDVSGAFFGWAAAHSAGWWERVRDPAFPVWEWLDREPALARIERRGVGPGAPAEGVFDLWRLATIGDWLRARSGASERGKRAEK